MSDESGQPTARQMLAHAIADLDRAWAALDSADQWVRGETRPVGAFLTEEQKAMRRSIAAAVAECKVLIDAAKRGAL